MESAVLSERKNVRKLISAFDVLNAPLSETDRLTDVG